MGAGGTGHYHDEMSGNVGETQAVLIMNSLICVGCRCGASASRPSRSCGRMMGRTSALRRCDATPRALSPGGANHRDEMSGNIGETQPLMIMNS
eukprot:COSAG01_NODE_2518_length_7524_cov_2.305724_7_plen_94_part_00